MYEKILIVTQKRNDAIGIVDKEITKLLGNKFHHIELSEKGHSTLIIIKNYIKNIIIILKRSRSFKKIFFTRENPYVIFVKFFYPQKRIFCTIHHIEDYRGNGLIGKLIFKSINHYIAISHFTKKQLIDHKVNTKKIDVVYNGISNKYYPEPIKKFLDYKYILHVGTEADRKNIPLLLKSFALVVKKYPNIKLVKIGKSANIKNQKQNDHLIQELGIGKNIIMLRNYVSDEELRKWYSNAIFYISVSILEGFGLTVPEAMACGCPVIVSDIPPFIEIVGDSQIIVNPHDIYSIIDGMMQYINNQDFRSQQSVLGLERVKIFDRNSSLNKLSNTLSK